MIKKEIVLSSLPAAIGPFAHAVRYGSLLFISGLTARDNFGKAASLDVVEQANFIYSSVDAILAEEGARFENILRNTIYLTNIEDREKIMPVRKKFFKESRPASTLVEVSSLVYDDLKIEVEITAFIPKL